MLFFVSLLILGFVLGRVAAGCAASMLVGMNCGGLLVCRSCKSKIRFVARWFSLRPGCSTCRGRIGWWPTLSAFGLAFVFCGFAFLLTDWPDCQRVHEVRPSSPMEWPRMPFHLALLFFLWVALLTDLLDYVIPDEIVYPGILMAVTAATAVGELQMIHIWVNWDEALRSIDGPYLPEWMKNHQHLHGLAWSTAGLATGAGITWLIRWLSGAILGYPALGFGDVTLMALIGAFIGWQPTLCVLAVAPLIGMIVGVVVRVATGRTFVAYGPYLVCSAMFVLCTWRWLWADYLELRIVFSHWPSVLILIGVAFGSLILLLGGLRLFRALPVSDLNR